MDPHDWQTATDPLAMLDEIFPQRGLDSAEPQSRSSRLYLVGCGRLARARLPGVCRAVVSLAERVFAGRQTDRRLRDEVYSHAEALVRCRGEADDVNAIGRALVNLGHADAAAVWATADTPPREWLGCAYLAFYPFYMTTPTYRNIPEELHSADLLREIFGDPLRRRPPLPREWLTPRVLGLAREAEATADFSILPILADALEDEGCDRTDLLDHLRGSGPHARGCWALEAVLGNRPRTDHGRGW